MDVTTRVPLATWSDGEEGEELLHLPLVLEALEAPAAEEEDSGSEEEEPPGRGRRPAAGSKRRAESLNGGDY